MGLKDLDPTLQEKLLEKRWISPSPSNPIKYPDCWWWKGATTGTMKEKYGVINIKGKNYYVHRVSANLWLQHNLNSNLRVLHKCDNPPCFNPEHLEINTQSKNIRDSIKRNRYHRVGLLSGEKHWNSKLTEKQVLEIHKLFKEGWTRGQLKDKFNIAYGTVCEILRKDNWKHLEI